MRKYKAYLIFLEKFFLVFPCDIIDTSEIITRMGTKTAGVMIKVELLQKENLLGTGRLLLRKYLFSITTL